MHSLHRILVSKGTKVVKVFVPGPEDCPRADSETEARQRFAAVNSKRSHVEVVESDHDADIVVLFEQWANRDWEYVGALFSDPFFRRNAHKLYTVNYDTEPVGFLPGCYTCLEESRFESSFHIAAGYPISYSPTIETAGVARPAGTRPLLFFFKGTVVSHTVRKDMVAALSGDQSGVAMAVDQLFDSHTGHERAQFLEDLKTAKFALCPRGYGTSSHRLFEAMAVGVCPVIISDAWVPPAGIDWEAISIRVRESDIGSIGAILRSREDDADRLGAAARTAFEQHFSFTSRNVGYLDNLLSLRAARDGEGRGLFTLNRRWTSKGFRARNGWQTYSNLEEAKFQTAEWARFAVRSSPKLQRALRVARGLENSGPQGSV